MKLIIILFIVLWMAPTASMSAETEVADEPDRLTIATRHLPPFAIKQDNGEWSGLSIELWQMMAKEMGVNYTFKEMALKEMLKAVEDGQVDAAIAAISITSEREAKLDFTHPFMSTGLGIAVHKNEGSGWVLLVERLFSSDFLKALTALLGLLLVIGIMVWIFDRVRFYLKHI